MVSEIFRSRATSPITGGCAMRRMWSSVRRPISTRIMPNSAGVRDYILTYMFQSPPQLSNAMDLARCLAILELSEAFAG